MKKKNNDPKQPTNHHIIPRSREKKGNIAIVPRENHELYHKLFSNLKPHEIVEFLNNHYWNNMFQITIKKRPPP